MRDIVPHNGTSHTVWESGVHTVKESIIVVSKDDLSHHDETKSQARSENAGKEIASTIVMHYNIQTKNIVQ